MPHFQLVVWKYYPPVISCKEMLCTSFVCRIGNDLDK